MWVILGLMVGGSLTGYLLSGIKKFNSSTEKITSYIVYLLLFFMGLSVGINDEIMNNIKDLGFQALLITFFTISGSILLAFFVEKAFFKNHTKDPDKKLKKSRL